MAKQKRIAKFVAKGKTDKVISLLKNKDIAVKQAAIAALGEIGDDNCLNTLVVLLRDPDAAIRQSAVRALGTFSTSDTRSSTAKTHLHHLKTNEKAPDVIQALEETFALISSNS